MFIIPCDDNVDRLCKGDDINPKAPCNEWVSAKIAQAAGFSILDPGIVTCGGQLYYATQYFAATDGVFDLTGPNDPRFLIAVNAQTAVYQAIALDAYVANPDRHHGNIIVAQDQSGPKTQRRAYIHDHDRALFGSPGLMPVGVARLRHLTSDWHDGWNLHHTAWVRGDNRWFEEIRDWKELEQCVRQITSIPNAALRAIVEQIPEEWIDDSERTILYRFLLRRKRKLAEIINNRRGIFPNAL